MSKYEIEIEGCSGRLPLAAETDDEINAAIQRAGLWKPGELYPDSTMFRDGEETGGGGGPNSGRMGEPSSLTDFRTPGTRRKGACTGAFSFRGTSPAASPKPTRVRLAGPPGGRSPIDVRPAPPCMG